MQSPANCVGFIPSLWVYPVLICIYNIDNIIVILYNIYDIYYYIIVPQWNIISWPAINSQQRQFRNVLTDPLVISRGWGPGEQKSWKDTLLTDKYGLCPNSKAGVLSCTPDCFLSREKWFLWDGCLVLIAKTRSHCVAHTGLKLMTTLLPEFVTAFF